MLVLNVDDDEDDREIFIDAVKAVDSEITSVPLEGGEMVLDFLRTNKTLPDYAFIDINMPKMNGYECAQEIRSNPAYDSIKIIMYSTAFNPQDLKQFSKLGFSFLTKHDTFRELVQSIKKLIT